MPSILVQLCPEIQDSRRLYLYRLANCDIASDTPLIQLAPFSRPHAAPHSLELCGYTGGDPEPEEGWGLVYEGQGWIGGGWQPVTCRAGAEGVRIRVCVEGEFLISAAGDSIRCLQPVQPAVSELLVEALLGPALILSLALQGIWCFHASAAVLDGRLAVFLGHSGAGKSTLASYLHQQQGAGWQRVVDDILPVAKPAVDLCAGQPDSPAALPHFPQLKLLQGAQIVDQKLEQLPIAAIYLLVNPDRQHAGVSLRPLAGRAAISALLSHTVAARLMPPGLLEKHINFCAWAADRVPIRVLNYPHRRSSLPAVQELLTSDLPCGILPG